MPLAGTSQRLYTQRPDMQRLDTLRPNMQRPDMQCLNMQRPEDASGKLNARITRMGIHAVLS